MIKEGQEKEAGYWGKFVVKKVARLKKPIPRYSDKIGEALFNPTLVKIEWERPPSEEKQEFWFPYWLTTGGKEKYGQYAPMIGEQALLELLEEAIKENFFSDNFLTQLSKVISDKLATK